MNNKRRILLLSPPTSTNRTPEECLGLEYIAAESRANGHEVIYLDAWMQRLSAEQAADTCVQQKPDVIGISPSMDSMDNAKSICQLLRQKKYEGLIVMGGIYASFEAGELLKNTPDIDGIITGEADSTFQKFLENLDLKSIPGAVYRNETGEVCLNPNDLMTINLDNLPFPTRDSIEFTKQWQTPSHVMGSRGCYGLCSFCSVACFQKFSSDKRWRGRSPDSILEELKLLSKNGETMVKFIDDNFFGPADRKREIELANKIIEANLNLRFRLSLRVNDVDDETIGLLKKAGLFAVSMGVESFVPRKLRFFNKGTTIVQNIRAVEILKKHGVYVQMGFIMFDPYITLEEIAEEIKGLKETRWVVTKGISTRLFAADGTKISEQIEKDIGFVGKEGANNLYEIADPNARTFAHGLSYWSRKLNYLYEKAIDPISAPKNIGSEYHQELHEICTELKDMDIKIAEELLNICKNNCDKENVETFINAKYTEYKDRLDDLQSSVDKIYDRTGLIFFSSGNKRV